MSECYIMYIIIYMQMLAIILFVNVSLFDIVNNHRKMDTGSKIMVRGLYLVKSNEDVNGQRIA